MPFAFLLCGPSLAGKSTLGRQIALQLGAAISSADAINARRGLPFGAEGLPESVWAETLRLQLDELRVAGAAGTSVVVDDTLCYRWLRDRFREAATSAGLTPRLLLLRPSTEVLLQRRSAAAADRSRPVLSLERLQAHLATFEWPSEDEGAADVTDPDRQATWLRAEQLAAGRALLAGGVRTSRWPRGYPS
jgi:predicted kinase